MMELTRRQLKRFWSKVIARGSDECWTWTAGKSGGGYGKVRIAGRLHGAHKISWILANGRLPQRGYDICHECDNPSCINPAHLFEKTHQENLQDAGRRGRIRNQWTTLDYRNYGSRIRDIEG